MKFSKDVKLTTKDMSHVPWDLGSFVDNGTTYANVGHIYRGDKDKCLEFLGEQDDECIKYNEKTN